MWLVLSWNVLDSDLPLAVDELFSSYLYFCLIGYRRILDLFEDLNGSPAGDRVPFRDVIATAAFIKSFELPFLVIHGKHSQMLGKLTESRTVNKFLSGT